MLADMQLLIVVALICEKTKYLLNGAKMYAEQYMQYRLEGILSQCYIDSEGTLVTCSNLSLSKAGNSSLEFTKSPGRNSMIENELNVLLLLF